MSKERYEIKGKIGQGGVGAVYTAFDTQLNREVAMKRLIIGEDAQFSSEDATESLLKEATALSALQHPHIVTVYDAGVDEDGPFVIMELIKGRTLDEMVERGTLTWEDFYELALQSQEALIAAQDLDLVHRDLKPANIMLCWLASGKFQIKIVDFGLAKFSAAPSLQTIDHGDAVFGSIFFMAPEQFERTPLDQRTDMYAMGCLYYYALTGQHPFNGETAPAVMASHLQHRIIDLKELRPDIPTWAADWVMWHMERNLEDRPLNARTALEKLITFDKTATQAVTTTAPVAAASPKFNFGASNDALEQVAAMEPTQPVQKIHSETDTTAPVRIMAPGANAINPHTQAQKTVNQIKAATMAQQVKAPAPTVAAPAIAASTTTAVTTATAEQNVDPATKGKPSGFFSNLSKAAKISIILILSLTIIVTLVLFFSQSGARNEARAYNAVIERAQELEKANKADEGLSVTLPELNALLNQSSTVEGSQQRRTIYIILSRLTGQGFDPDPVMVKYITEAAMSDEEIRITLLNLVMANRSQPNNIKPLLSFAESTNNTETAIAAINAAKENLDLDDAEQHFDSFLDIIKYSEKPELINAAQKTASEILLQSKNASRLSPSIIKSYESSSQNSQKFALLRLLGSTRTEEAGQVIIKSLDADNDILAGAALSALQKWPNATLLKQVTEYIRSTTNRQLKERAFMLAISMTSSKNPKYISGQLQEDLESLDLITENAAQQRRIIQRAANINKKWAHDILSKYAEDNNRTLSALAKKALAQFEK